jgi:hypothetical protein
MKTDYKIAALHFCERKIHQAKKRALFCQATGLRALRNASNALGRIRRG